MAAVAQLISKDDLAELSAGELALLESTVCGAVTSNEKIQAVLKEELQDSLRRIKAARGSRKH